jgi:Domain of unknown function (DUF6391)
MTSTSSSTNPFSFDFAPQTTQDTDLVAQFGFLPGLQELLTVRQVHALEHATVWVLGESNRSHVSADGNPSPLTDNESLGGMSTEKGFYLYGNVTTSDLRRAVQTALQRIQDGEWELAVHPRCGTNLSVGMLLGVGLALTLNQILPKTPLEQLLGLGIAATTAAEIAPDLGQWVQRYVTTAIPFNLAIADIIPTQDMWGRPAHFVRVRWRQ